MYALNNADPNKTVHPCHESSLHQKNRCLLVNALTENNLSVCEDVGAYRGFCYYLFAAKDNNPELCKEAQKFMRECYFNITVQRGNVELCKHSSSDCVVNAALLRRNISFCSFDKNPSQCITQFQTVHPFSQSCMVFTENESSCFCDEDEVLLHDSCKKLICEYGQMIEKHECKNICEFYQFYKNGKCYMECEEGFVSNSDGQSCRKKTTLYIKEIFNYLKIPILIVLLVIVGAGLLFASVYLFRKIHVWLNPYVNWVLLRYILFALILSLIVYITTVSTCRSEYSHYSERCTGTAGFDCVDRAYYDASTGHLKLHIQNNFGENITILANSLTGSGDCTQAHYVMNDRSLPSAFAIGRTTPEKKFSTFYGVTNNVTINQGESFTIELYCNTKVERFKSEMKIGTQNQQGTLSEVTVQIRSNDAQYIQHKIKNCKSSTLFWGILFSIFFTVLIYFTRHGFKGKIRKWFSNVLKFRFSKLFLTFVFTLPVILEWSHERYFSEIVGELLINEHIFIIVLMILFWPLALLEYGSNFPAYIILIIANLVYLYVLASVLIHYICWHKKIPKWSWGGIIVILLIHVLGAITGAHGVYTFRAIPGFIEYRLYALLSPYGMARYYLWNLTDMSSNFFISCTEQYCQAKPFVAVPLTMFIYILYFLIGIAMWYFGKLIVKVLRIQR